MPKMAILCRKKTKHRRLFFFIIKQNAKMTFEELLGMFWVSFASSILKIKQSEKFQKKNVQT